MPSPSLSMSAKSSSGEVPLEGLLIASPALVEEVLYFGTPDGHDTTSMNIWDEEKAAGRGLIASGQRAAAEVPGSRTALPLTSRPRRERRAFRSPR